MLIIICYAQGKVEEALKTLEDYKAKINAKQEKNKKFFNTPSLQSSQAICNATSSLAIAAKLSSDY